jgi:hypothetical protein
MSDSVVASALRQTSAVRPRKSGSATEPVVCCDWAKPSASPSRLSSEVGAAAQLESRAG